MTDGRTATAKQLGIIALAANNHPKGLSDHFPTDQDERFFMLATFCFDLSRKLKYISLALSDFYGDADPKFAARIQADERYINPKPEAISWEIMAHRAEEVMKRLYQEVHDEGYPWL